MQNEPFPLNPNKSPLGFALLNVFNKDLEDNKEGE